MKRHTRWKRGEGGCLSPSIFRIWPDFDRCRIYPSSSISFVQFQSAFYFTIDVNSIPISLILQPMLNYLQNLRRYLPFGASSRNEQDQLEEGQWDGEEGTDERGTTPPGWSSPTPRAQRTAERGVQPPRGKFLKRSETAPRPSSSSSGVGSRLAERRQQLRRPTSATPHSEGEAPNSAMDNLTARLSRRSSIISDLVALMVRRSSSFGKGRKEEKEGGESDKDDGEEDEAEDEEDEEGEPGEDLGNMPRERILQKIRHHKEIIGKVRLQPWPMRRKRRALKVARQYLQRQEARVSKWNLYKVELNRRFNKAWRWVKNLSIYLIPWESKIKQIESNFGSVVSSYFIFLRWVLGMNVTTSFLVMLFIIVPEWLADSQNDPVRFNQTRHIKVIPQKELPHADELNSVLDFGGYLQYSYLFYGFYSSQTELKGIIMPYNVPVAYFCVNLFLLVFCIFVILKKMTSNTRKSKLSSGKQEQYVFTWKVVNGWDYNLGESETASSLAMANVIKLKEASTEYKKKFKQKWTCQTFFLRLFVNVVIMMLIGLSMLAISMVSQITDKDTFIKQNAMSITVALITLLFPPVFELILKLEQYRPRTALRIHLFRVLVFYLINYFTVVTGLFAQLKTIENEMRENTAVGRSWAPAYQSGPAPYGAGAFRPRPFQARPFPTINRTFYEMIARNPPQFASTPKRPFFMFASLSSEKRRYKREFMWRRRWERKGPRSGRRRKKRPIPEGDGTGTVVYSSKPMPEPTPAPGPRPWTTIQPHFGPFNVGNPKAIVVPARNGPRGTIYESRVIGPSAAWGATTDVPIPLNYTAAAASASQTVTKTPKARRPFKQRMGARTYDELCWETRIGQEIAKIVTTDLVVTVAAILVIDFLRGLWIRFCSDWWCWDIEDTFPEYGEFKVAENVLHLVNSQGMVCLGTILVPMLPLINCVKLVLMMYIRAWACMVCNVPAKQIFRASRSSNFYFWLLLMMLCISTLPVGYVIAYKRPSKNCGPFASQEHFYSIIGVILQRNLDPQLVAAIGYLSSPGIVIPVLLLMFLVIYFLVLLVNGLRAANTDLNKQLTLERTEEKRKIFELAKGRGARPGAAGAHQYRPSGESRGRGGNGDEDDTGNGAALLAKARERLSPLYFLNGAAKSMMRKSWHGAAERAGDGGILLNPLVPQKRQPLWQQDESGSGSSPSSPSKSPLRQPAFLPSLQSVDEEEDDDRHGGQRGEDDESPLMERASGHAEAWISTEGGRRGQEAGISWRERLLMCIGWPEKEEEKMRRRMKRRGWMKGMEEEGRDEEEKEEEEGEEEEPDEEGRALVRRRSTSREMRKGMEGGVGGGRGLETPVMEEAEYSVPSEKDEEEEEEAEDEDREGREEQSGSRGADTVLMAPSPEGPRNERSSEEEEEERGEGRGPEDQGSSTDGDEEGSVRTESQRSWVHHQPAGTRPGPGTTSRVPESSSIPLLFARPSPSLHRDGTLNYPGERTTTPKGSTDPQLRRSSFPTGELFPTRPSLDKHRRGNLPPLAPKMPGGGIVPTEEEQHGRTGRNGSRMEAESGDEPPGSHAPSEPSISLAPVQPAGQGLLSSGVFRPISPSPSSVLGHSFASSSSGTLDSRFRYADPYSSYAAAMCSPIIPPPSDSSRLARSPQYSPLPAASSLRRAPSAQQQQQSLAGYATPTLTSEYPRKPPERPEPIYDQPAEQRRPSTSAIPGPTGDEGGSTSGRGTMPPGYGSSPGSSPEFGGYPKYRISSMSPGRARIAGMKGAESGSSPEQASPQLAQWRRRQFDIRQRSGLGLGHPLRRAGGGNGRGRWGEEQGKRQEQGQDKQSTV